MIKKTGKILVLIALSIIFIVGCSKSANEKAGNGKQLTISTVKGDVKVPENPKKVAVFDYAALDVIGTLGVKPELALPASNVPEGLKQYAQGAVDAGDVKEPNLEKISEFKPDLIIISGRQSKFYDELSKIAPTIFLETDTKNFISSSNENAKKIASIFGKEKEADEQIAKINSEINDIKNIAKNYNKKALVTLTNDGKISAFGANSRFGFIFTDLGLKNIDDSIKASTHGQEINYEYIAEKNPDIIFYVDRTKIVGGSKNGGDVLKNELVAKTNAGKNNKVVALDAENWYLGSGGLATIQKQLEEIKTAITK